MKCGWSVSGWFQIIMRWEVRREAKHKLGYISIGIDLHLINIYIYIYVWIFYIWFYTISKSILYIWTKRLTLCYSPSKSLTMRQQLLVLSKLSRRKSILNCSLKQLFVWQVPLVHMMAKFDDSRNGWESQVILQCSCTSYIYCCWHFI